MPTGRIKYYNFDKGFGFIAQDSSDADVFLHSSAMKQPEYEELRVGQRVKYNVVEGEKGLVAQNVEVLLTPTERRWLRQGKAIIPRGYSAGFPGQHQGFLSEEEMQGAAPASSRRPPVPRRQPKPAGAAQPTDERRAASGATSPAAQQVEPESKQLSFGDLYILKQINLETSMFFAVYNRVQLPAIVLEMTLSSLTLNSNGQERVLAKTDVKYCYKDMDAAKVRASLAGDDAVKALELKPVRRNEEAYALDTEIVREARKNGDSIEVTLREGEIFRGVVDWVSPYEVKLILENGAKVVVFRHALYDFKVFPAAKGS